MDLAYTSNVNLLTLSPCRYAGLVQTLGMVLASLFTNPVEGIVQSL